MIEIHHTYRPLIFAARCIAFPIVVLGYMLLMLIPAHEYWEHLRPTEVVAFAMFLAYAIFILVPIQRFRPSFFRPAIAVGAVLAICSSWYPCMFLAWFLRDHPACLIVTCLLLLPLYPYIPIMILNRKYETSHRQSHAINAR